MHLVDTSSWIHSLRPLGDAQVRARVERLVRSGDACWCAMVKLELWNGARKEHERRILKDMEDRLMELEITQGVWQLACELARKARQGGITVPATDLLRTPSPGGPGALGRPLHCHREDLKTITPWTLETARSGFSPLQAPARLMGLAA